MKISTKGRYALEAVVDLAYHAQEELESIKNISDHLGVSKNYLEQIFVHLRKNGIVDSVRGAQGGYRLSKPSSQISAGDVIRAVEGNLLPVACVENKVCVQDEGSCEACITQSFWIKMTDAINQVVDHISIADLVEDYEKRQIPSIEYFI